MKDFVFDNTTKVYFGRNQLNHLTEEINRLGNHVLFVYGGGSIKRTGLYDKILSLLKDAGVMVTEYSGVEPNPRHTTVNKGAALCHEQNIGVILAVGGGSVIDCSKGIAATALADTGDVWDLVEGKKPVTQALPIIAVPTMAASGSEMNSGGVISNLEKKVKRALKSPLLRPVVTFADPTNTFTVSAYQTACGSLDIMSHVFDAAYFSEQEQLNMILQMQEDLFKTVIKFAPIALEYPNNYEARANLMWASMWAVNDFLSSGVRQAAACHIIEHELSAYYDITHGHGMAIILPRWLTYILDETTAPRIYRFGRNCFQVPEGLSDLNGAKQSIVALSNFCFKTLGLSPHLSDFGIDEKYFEEMAEHACENGSINSFKSLNKDDIVEILKTCL